jgi:CBS domain-containing protein
MVQMSERTRRIRHTPVQECVSLLPIDPLLVHPGDDPLEVMHRAAERPQTRLLGVVDDAGVLDIADIADAARFGHAVSASTVEDVMVTPATISETATIDEAFRRMHARRLSGLYVIDEAGRPTGYLDLLELTMRYVEALEDDRPPVDPRTEA